jgi:predicted RNA-binding Zn-ribbon protein involved in translation (DUF1610 family)
MPAKVSPEEEKRRLAALKATVRDDQPQGSVAEAARLLGMSPGATSRFLVSRKVIVGNIPKRTKAQCIEELREFYKVLGRVPARDEWRDISPHRGAWRTHWARYEDFIRDSRVYGEDPKILLLDIETAPNLAYVWGLWKQNINPEWIAANGYVLCWAAKWLGKDEVMFKRLRKGQEKSLLAPIKDLLGEARAVVHYNGKKFDIPTLNKEFLTHGMNPPSPYKQIDLLQTMWATFRFPSNKLDYVSQTLKIGEKVRHKGSQLWLDCMADKKEAWALMEEYNKQDVVLLERLYQKLLPWIKGHPNMASYLGAAACPSCGSEEFRRDGTHLAQVLRYERYQCAGCGSWFRGTKTISVRGVQRFAAAA